VPKLSTQSAASILDNPTVYTPGERIAPMRNALGGNAIIKRMPYPQTARNLNSNTPPDVAVSTPVWWDIK
jgi:hypothetical protein